MMRRNRYPGTCADCKQPIGVKQGYLFGSSNAVVCEDCVYDFYGLEHKYFVRIENPDTGTS
ncbi:hypothetical protein H0264_18490 [Nocardia huaxiensis]|uniref:Uncharacterized protein n=1 Tax=Nocardia huaxiensis TaxID=2755382 RepID=A0A7D6VNW6_9NOCA|nr:hypothetical protein [Nocardia huaxiensis]QLY33950.1 hypothetical protein H0264_18490 [Nocardia huaxiensis]